MMQGSAHFAILSTQIPRDQPKLFQRRLQVLHDLLGDNVRRREVLGAGQVKYWPAPDLVSYAFFSSSPS